MNLSKFERKVNDEFILKIILRLKLYGYKKMNIAKSLKKHFNFRYCAPFNFYLHFHNAILSH